MNFGSVPSLEPIESDQDCWFKLIDLDNRQVYGFPKLGEMYTGHNELGEQVVVANYIGRSMMHQFNEDVTIKVDDVYGWRLVEMTSAELDD